MSEKDFGLDVFRRHLLGAAGHWLELAYPEWVRLHRIEVGTGGLDDPAASISLPAGSEVRFAEFRRLLTATHDLELSIHSLRICLRLLGSTPESASHRQLSEGEWEYYHYQMWAYTLAATLERAKTLIVQTLRSLRRPYDRKGFAAVSADLLLPIEKLRTRLKAIRDPLAHGGGPVEEVARMGLYESMSAMKVWPRIAEVLKPLQDNHPNRYRMIRTYSINVIAVTGKMLERLTGEIDWERAGNGEALPDPNLDPNPRSRPSTSIDLGRL